MSESSDHTELVIQRAQGRARRGRVQQEVVSDLIDEIRRLQGNNSSLAYTVENDGHTIQAQRAEICALQESNRVFMEMVDRGQRLDLSAELHDLIAERTVLEARLVRAAELPKLIDEHFLVRDIQGDGDPAWALKILPKLRRLATAIEAIRGDAKPEGREDETDNGRGRRPDPGPGAGTG
jgi:hypothetical protein